MRNVTSDFPIAPRSGTIETMTARTSQQLRGRRRRARPLHLALSGALCLLLALACISAYPRWVEAGNGPAVTVVGLVAAVFLVAALTFLLGAVLRRLTID